MIIIVSIGLLIAFLYYSDINSAEDPRVIEAKHKYKQYNMLIEANDFEGVMLTLDTIENIYLKYDDYKKSYEIGVVNNNRAAAYLSKALYQTDNEKEKDSLLIISKYYTIRAINYYINWIDEFENLSETEIIEYFTPIYNKNIPIFEKDKIDKYLNKRVDDIILAQRETKRRLSVSYTNLGIIFRHQLELDSATQYYVFALQQWEKNFIAENNLNVLLGRPVKKRNFIQKLFPSEK